MTEASKLGYRYILGAPIGRGGMAEVFAARDERLGRNVAVKILRPALAADPAFHARFRREAQASASLNHPNIVAVYDTGEDTLHHGGTTVPAPYIVMEQVDGQTLRHLIAAPPPLLPERALDIAEGILVGLDYSHRHGIVHRDIKPANIMLTPAGDVKVMDFGIARALSDASATMTAANAVMGTAHYLSPEQARGEVVDARADLYSTGCLLYEMLTGRPPFTHGSPVDVAYQHVHDTPAPCSHVDANVPARVDPLLFKALAKDPDDRYQTAADFRNDIRRTRELLNPGLSDSRNTPEPSDTSSPRRRPWIVGVGAGVSAVLIGGLLFLTNHASATTPAPAIVGKTVQQARDVLNSQGLTLGTQTTEPSTLPEGDVLSQTPEPGVDLADGRAINVTVSSGLGTIQVPALAGLLDADAAQDTLNNAGLNLGAVSQQSSTLTTGTVLSQSPTRGLAVDRGSSVNIAVSTGMTPIPNVVGNSSQQADTSLTVAGFTVRQVTRTSNKPAGFVISQSPAAESQALVGATVKIVVARNTNE